ncbi:MAG: Zn-dependent exopeptidase M28 [Thermoplasmatales archaeon]|nr:MAG: Zn-dependent exopeptidase M28 [Thermoplasmatales archaeon]
MKNISKYISFWFGSILILMISLTPLGHSYFPSNVSSFNDNDIIDMINQVNESRIMYFYENLMEFGVRYTGTSNCSMAGDWIYDEFVQMGLEVEFHHWKRHKFESRNVVATLPGHDPSTNAIFIICAHYDTFINSPGANDDGSGVVAILTIAEILSKYSFNHTIQFIAFSGEEVGAYGSFNYARDAYNRGDNIFVVLNLDIIGYAETTQGGRILRYFHEEPSTWIAEFAQTISTKYLNIIDMTVESLPNYPGADNQAFVDYGYDGVWIAQHDPNRVGHSPDDTLENINITYHMKATKLMLAVLAELATRPIPIQVILRAPLEGMGYINNNPLFKLSFAEYSYLRLRGITIIIGRAMACAEVICKENVRYVIFSINDVFTLWDGEEPYEWKIQGKFYPLIGRHKLKVFAYSESGEMDTDEMEIIFLSLSYQYGKW